MLERRPVTFGDSAVGPAGRGCMMDDHTADETFRGDANKDKCIKFFRGVKSVAGEKK